MSKNRNSFAKRSREMDKKRSAEEKRTRKATRRLNPESGSAEGGEAPLSANEQSVLAVFRQFMMSPNRMLCFSGKDHLDLGEALLQMVEKKLLVAEKFLGSYSLTDTGYAAMQASGA